MRGLMLILLLLLVTTEHVRAEDEKSADLDAETSKLVQGHLDRGEYGAALAVFTARIKAGGASVAVYAGAAEAALKHGRYESALAHAKAGQAMLQKLPEQTTASRALRKRLVAASVQSKRLKKQCDRTVPMIVENLVRALGSSGTYLDHKYLTKKSVPLPNYRFGGHKLREKYRSPHLDVSYWWDPGTGQRLEILEHYSDLAAAEARVAATIKTIRLQRKKWERYYRKRHKVKSASLREHGGAKKPYLKRGSWVLSSLMFRWKAPDLATADMNILAAIQLTQKVESGETKPAPHAWYTIRVFLDATGLSYK